MTKVKVAINGFGTIGKRVADAVQMQKDMEIVGVSKTKPNFEAFTALDKGYSLYAPSEKIKDMEKGGIKAAGTVEDMIAAADIVVDCTPTCSVTPESARSSTSSTRPASSPFGSVMYLAMSSRPWMVPASAR